MNLRTAIKVLLIYVYNQEAGRHAAEGTSLHPTEAKAFDLLTRYTSGLALGEPGFIKEGRAGLRNVEEEAQAYANRDDAECSNRNGVHTCELVRGHKGNHFCSCGTFSVDW